LQAPRGTRLSEPAPRARRRLGDAGEEGEWMRPSRSVAVDMRVGSATDGLAPVSTAQRSLAARAHQWLALAAIAFAALAADQVTKHLVSSQLSLDGVTHVVGPLSIHHVQ